MLCNKTQGSVYLNKAKYLTLFTLVNYQYQIDCFFATVKCLIIIIAKQIMQDLIYAFYLVIPFCRPVRLPLPFHLIPEKYCFI